MRPLPISICLSIYLSIHLHAGFVRVRVGGHELVSSREGEREGGREEGREVWKYGRLLGGSV